MVSKVNSILKSSQVVQSTIKSAQTMLAEGSVTPRAVASAALDAFIQSLRSKGPQ
jgi:hypothetical protein